MNASQKNFVSQVWFKLSQIDQFPIQQQVEIANTLVTMLKNKIEGAQRLTEFNQWIGPTLAQIDRETAARQAAEEKARKAAEKQKKDEEAAAQAAKAAEVTPPPVDEAPAVDTVSDK